MAQPQKRAGLTSVQIRPQIAKMLVPYLRGGASKSELINEALRQYLIEKEFQEMRSKMIPFAQARGIYTEEDIEKKLG